MEAHGLDSVTPAYFKGTHGVILVYNLSDSTTLHVLVAWIRRIHECSSPEVKLVFSLWGNDLDEGVNPVSDTDLQDFMKEHGISKSLHFIVSAESSENVKESFVKVVRAVKEDNRSAQLAEYTITMEHFQYSDYNSTRRTCKC